MSGFSSSSARRARTSPKTGASGAERAYRAAVLEQGAQRADGLRSRSAAAASMSRPQHGVVGQLGVVEGDRGDPQPQRGGQHAYGQALRARHAADLAASGAQRAAGERVPSPRRW